MANHYFEAPLLIVNGDMNAASVISGAIQVGPRGDVFVQASWQNTGSPSGTLSLQYKDLLGTLRDVPGASAEFTANGNSQPNNDNKTVGCYWREMRAFGEVFLKYTKGSGGTGNTTLQAQAWSD